MFSDPFTLIRELPNVKKTRFQTPGAGKTGRPFQIIKFTEDEIFIRTSRGGRVRLRMEVFQVGEQLLRDLGQVEEDGWVLLSDDTLNTILRGENRDNACSSYVFPLLEAVGLVEIQRSRPVKLRLKPSEQTEAEE